MKNHRPQLLLIRAAAADAIGILAAAQLIPLPAEAGAPLPTEFVWMPKGEHELTAFATDGSPWRGKVRCDEEGFHAVQAAFIAATTAGHRVPLDKDHEDKEATAWVLGFRWDPARGILVKVEWTSLGEQLLRGKVYHSFSPAFFLNKKTGRVAGLPGGGHAAGSLVNAPAFGPAMPSLIAARLAGAANPQPASGGTPDTQKAMNRELLVKILAALAVQHAADATEEQLVTLVTKHIDRLPEAGPEGQALKAQLAELQSLKAKAAELDQVKAKVTTLEQAAAERRKADAKAAVEKAVARGALPAKDEVIQAKWRGMIESNPDHAELLASLPGNPALERVTQPGGHITTKAGPVEVLKAYAKASGADRPAIYAKDIAPLFQPGFALGPILAANSLGTLTGDLVTQRALTLLKQSFPVLRSISTDFSAENAAFGQAVKTRLRTVPAVSDYDTSTGYPTADATTTDVAITIDNHKAVQIGFNANELASTQRDIFGEQAEGAHYALGKALVDALYALITAGNFANATTKALANFGRADVTAMAKALYNRGVPEMGRTLLLNPDYFEKLGQDATLVSLAAFQKPEVITDWVLPPVAKFNIIQAVNLPGTGNLTGFGFTPDALAMATRVPNDYTQALPGASHGSVSVVTNPDTGISVQLVQYVNHQLGASYWRIALMFGVAKGQAASGQRLISA